MFHLKRTICPLLVLATLASAGAAQAATYYVATTGNDEYSCSVAQNPSTPKATIPAGVSCLASGDDLIVRAGTYSGGPQFFINNPPSGTASNYTVIKADPAGARPVVNLDYTTSQRFVVCNTGSTPCAYIEVNGFEVVGAHEGFNIVCNPTCGHHWRILNNYIHHTRNTAIISGPDDSLIQGNEFSHVGFYNPGYVPGMNTIYGPGHRTIVERNVFHDSTHGVGIWPDYANYVGIIVRKNLFYNMGRFDLNPWGAGANYSSAIQINSCGTNANHLIYNNVVYNSGYTGVTGSGGTTAPGKFGAFHETYCLNGSGSFYNNTVYNVLDSGATALSATHSPINIKNNIAYLVGGGIVGGTQSNNLTTDPSFVDAATSNFRPRSPAAIDAGATIPEVTVDYAGTPRPQGAAYDIGAYEGAGGSDTASPAAPTGLSIH